MMRRFITIVLLFLIVLATPVYAEVDTSEITFSNVTSNRFDGYLRSWFGQVNTDVSAAGSNLGTGKAFYVDSAVGSDTYTGTKPELATATIDAAIALCTASRGDVIYVMQGHNEAVIAADGVDVDVAGVTIIGLGNGSLKPTIDYDHADGEFVIGAANVTISNLRFRVSANAVTKALEVETAGDYASIVGCEFGYAETSTDEFATSIIVDANFVTIDSCVIKTGGQAAISAISVPSTQSDLTVTNNWCFGDCSTATFSSVGVLLEAVIRGNILFNGTMGGDGELNTEPAIEVADDSSGFILDNRIVSDVATGILMRVADDMCFMNNFILDTDGDEFSGTKEEDAASITKHVDG